MRRVVAALIHHPVLDRQGEVVTTAITNLDLHDIARSALTYGVSDFFVVHPVAAQRELATRIRDHWVDGSGGRRIPDRKPAMALLRIVESFDDVIAAFDEPAQLWTTSAGSGSFSHAEARSELATDGAPVILGFGTGWGLASSIVERAARRVAPIESPTPSGYNHLSVRAAAAILFDRLLSAAPARPGGPGDP